MWTRRKKILMFLISLNFFVCFGMRPFATKKKRENDPVYVKEQVSKFTKIPTAMMVFTTWRGFFEKCVFFVFLRDIFSFFWSKRKHKQKKRRKTFLFSVWNAPFLLWVFFGVLKREVRCNTKNNRFGFFPFPWPFLMKKKDTKNVSPRILFVLQKSTCLKRRSFLFFPWGKKSRWLTSQSLAGPKRKQKKLLWHRHFRNSQNPTHQKRPSFGFRIPPAKIYSEPQ